ncbi:hypothetical protein V6N13_056947 [Hibiscus sabdariffa]
MFPYPLHSLDEVSRTPNIRLLENIDSLVDPYLSDLVFTVNDSQLNVKVSILDGVQFSPIEGSGLPLPDNDLQAAKWGKAAKLTGATDMLKGMEIDDQPELIPISDDFTIMSECEKGSDVPLTASYARIMSRACKQVVSNPVLSMDDVVVESGDVTMDMTDGPHTKLISDITASVLKVSENRIYGPWMLTNTRCRQPCKDVGRPKGMVSTGAGL